MISTKVGQLQQLYNYLSTNRPNQLSQVTDSETTSSNTDIEGTHSYLYDAIGNIVENNEPFGVTDITWDVYNKVRTTSSPYKNQSYYYDAMGNRVTTVAGTSSTFYIRDPQGNVLSLYKSQGNDPPTQAEAHIYGSSRHGMAMLNRTASAYQESTGQSLPTIKRYELSNHLGNVLTTITGRRMGMGMSGQPATHFEPERIQASDYYAYGLEMPSRKYENSAFSGTNSYRYGFNGKELDKSGEFGSLTHYDYGFRIYNPSIGKFLSVDPLSGTYPWYTPYQFAGNKPIWAVDLDGLEERFATSPSEGNKVARDQSAPNQIINPHPFNKPLVSIVGEDEIGPYSYYGKNPSAFIHNRKIELFWRTGQALQNGGIITSIYYQTSDPSLQELETVSAAEGNFLNLFGAAKRSQPIPKYVAAPQAKNVKVSWPYNYKSVSKRHRGLNVDQKTLARAKNTVFDESVNIRLDREIINSGKAINIGTLDGNQVFQLTNGRQYTTIGNELVPLGGPGVYDLNRAQFKILGILNQMGLENSSKILTNVGYNKDDINRAVSVYQSIQSSNNISTP